MQTRSQETKRVVAGPSPSWVFWGGGRCRRAIALAIGAAATVSAWGMPALGQVNIPEEFEVVEFNRSYGWKMLPDMNDCGQVVFAWKMTDSHRSWEIFMYDNGRLIRLTENQDVDYDPQINNDGTIVYTHRPGEGDPTDVIMLKDGEKTLLDHHRKGVGGGVALNDLDHVAWSRTTSDQCPITGYIVLWDGHTTRRISPRELYDQTPSLNEFDQVAYSHSDFCIDPWWEWRGVINLYSDGHTETLPSNELQVQEPKLNNLGHVVWAGAPEIEFFRDGRTETIFERGVIPAINDLDDIYVAGWDATRERWQPWLLRFSENPNPGRYRLAEDGDMAGRAALNSWGELVWLRHDGDFRADNQGLGLMRRIRTGDSEFDGDIDLVDYAKVADCLMGPIPRDGLCQCRFLDIDHDGDVDLRDFASFQNAFGMK